MYKCAFAEDAYLQRLENGNVLITVKDKSYEIESGIWVSLVLTMTAFSERPNDWHAFLAHHQGKSDLLESEKKLQVIKNVLSR